MLIILTRRPLTETSWFLRMTVCTYFCSELAVKCTEFTTIFQKHACIDGISKLPITIAFYAYM